MRMDNRIEVFGYCAANTLGWGILVKVLRIFRFKLLELLELKVKIVIRNFRSVKYVIIVVMPM